MLSLNSLTIELPASPDPRKLQIIRQLPVDLLRKLLYDLDALRRSFNLTLSRTPVKG